MFKDYKNLKYFLIFFLILYLGLNIFMLIVNGFYSNYNSFNFNTIKDKYVIDTKSLDRKSILKIKFAYIENYEKVDFGLFGNHIAQYHSKDKYTLNQNLNFFNFWYANISLTEVHHLLIYLDKIGKLPDKILIAITTPNNDMGGSIIRYRGEIPINMISFKKVFKDLNNNFSEFFSFTKNYFSPNIFIKNTDYMRIYQTLRETFLRKNVNKWDISEKLIQIKDCKDTIMGTKTSNCYLGLKYDGSTVPKYYSHTKLIKYGNSKTLPTKLSSRDKKIIAYQMNSIQKFLKEKGKKVIFFIPPVYEEERETIAKKIFDKSLNEIDKDLKLIDHRNFRKKKSFFENFDHTSNEYFKYLIDEINNKYNF